MAKPEDLVGYKEWKKVVRDKVASRFPQGVVARVTYLVLDHERWLLALYEKLKEEVAELDLAARHLMAHKPHATTSLAIGGESVLTTERICSTRWWTCWTCWRRSPRRWDSPLRKSTGPAAPSGKATVGLTTVPSSSGLMATTPTQREWSARYG
jgi:hypothetical protein